MFARPRLDRFVIASRGMNGLRVDVVDNLFNPDPRPSGG